MNGQLLDRHEDVVELADRIRADGVMGLDTEFISERTYQPQLALLQVSTRDEIFLIDPLADHIQEAPDQPIWDLMADASVRTVVHSLDQEAQFCVQRTGKAPGDLFDVQLAAAFSGHYYPIAYDKLVGRELRRGVGPSQSRTNWLQRPLTSAQCRYAADDVRWLIGLHDRFLSRMSEDPGQWRFDWLREETEARLGRLSRRETERWRRLSGANKLPPRSLAALRELSSWRESVASERNVPFRRIASDDLLVAIASTRPTSTAELSSVRGIGQIKQAYFADVLGAVESALAIPDAELPARASRHHGGKPSRMVVLFLESVLAAACATHEIDPDLVGGSSQLRALVSWNENGRPAERRPGLITGWRGEVCGEPLLDALEGRISLRINDPLSANPLAVGGLPSGS
ncbi:MAG: HRDC domain-containing protein [Chloroflexota bacterium]|nr:HRDC domain-containing protein [Chloroflexota bacterium]